MKKIIPLILVSLIFSCISKNGIDDKYATEMPDWVQNKPGNTETHLFFIGGPSKTRDAAKQQAYKEISRHLGVAIDSVATSDKTITTTERETAILEVFNESISALSAGSLFGVEFIGNWRNASTKEWWTLAKVERLKLKEMAEKTMRELEEKKKLEAEAAAQDTWIRKSSLKEALYASCFQLAQAGKNAGIDNVALGNFYLGNKLIASDFSNFIRTKLETEIIKNNFFTVIDVKSVINEYISKNINPSDLRSKTGFTRGISVTPYNGGQNTSVTTAKTSGNINSGSAPGYIYGKFNRNGKDIEVNLFLKTTGDNKIISAADFSIPAEAIPKGIELKPGNYVAVEDITSTFNAIKSQSHYQGSNSANNNEIIDLWIDKGEGGVYTPGEKMIINVRTQKSCYIKIFYISAAGDMTMVFPNRYDKNNFISAGSIKSLGATGYNFTFDITPPYGTEIIQVIASETPFTDLTNEAYVDVVTNYGNTRGISVKAVATKGTTKNKIIGTATCFYTVIK